VIEARTAQIAGWRAQRRIRFASPSNSDPDGATLARCDVFRPSVTAATAVKSRH
jgi:hypothetical protein